MSKKRKVHKKDDDILIAKGTRVMYDGPKGTFESEVTIDVKKDQTYAFIKTANDSMTVAVRSLTIIKPKKGKKLAPLVLIPQPKPSVREAEDDMVYLSRVFRLSVGKIYKCIINMMYKDAYKHSPDGKVTSESGERYFKTEIMDSKDIAKLLANVTRAKLGSSPSLEERGISPGILDTFPPEIVIQMMLHMSEEDILNFCYTSKAALEVCNDPRFQADYLALHSRPIDRPLRRFMLNLGFPHKFTIQKYLRESKIWATIRRKDKYYTLYNNFTYHYKSIDGRSGIYTSKWTGDGKKIYRIELSFHYNTLSLIHENKYSKMEMLLINMNYLLTENKIYEDEDTLPLINEPGAPVGTEPDIDPNDGNIIRPKKAFPRLKISSKNVEGVELFTLNKYKRIDTYISLPQIEITVVRNSMEGNITNEKTSVLVPDVPTSNDGTYDIPISKMPLDIALDDEANTVHITDPYLIEITNRAGIFSLLEGRHVREIVRDFVDYDTFIKEEVEEDKIRDSIGNSLAYTKSTVLTYHREPKEPWITRV